MSVPVQTGNPNGTDFGNGNVIDYLHNPGQAAQGVLRIAANVAEGETVVIGGTTLKFATIATDSTKVTANGDLNNTDNISAVGITAHGLVAGDLIRVGSEQMRVIGVPNANRIIVLRGVSGTTIAAHADAVAIFKQAASGAAASTILVGLNATFTPTAATPALVADINELRNARGNVFAEAAMAIQVSVNEVVVCSALRSHRLGILVPVAAVQGSDGSYAISTLATTETLAGAGNAWDAATLQFGIKPGPLCITRRAPIAAEVTAGVMHFVFPFTPVTGGVRAKIITTSTQAAKAYDGAITITGNRVTIDNSGATDWATTDQVELTVQG